MAATLHLGALIWGNDDCRFQQQSIICKCETSKSPSIFRICMKFCLESINIWFFSLLIAKEKQQVSEEFVIFWGMSENKTEYTFIFLWILYINQLFWQLCNFFWHLFILIYTTHEYFTEDRFKGDACIIKQRTKVIRFLSWLLHDKVRWWNSHCLI